MLLAVDGVTAGCVVVGDEGAGRAGWFVGVSDIVLYCLSKLIFYDEYGAYEDGFLFLGYWTGAECDGCLDGYLS